MSTNVLFELCNSHLKVALTDSLHDVVCTSNVKILELNARTQEVLDG